MILKTKSLFRNLCILSKYCYPILFVLLFSIIFVNGCKKEKSEEEIKITVMMQDHPSTSAIQKLLDEFPHKKIKVVLDILPQEQIYRRTQDMFLKGTDVVDVIMFDHMFTTQFASEDYLVDLDQYIEKEKFDIDDFLAGFRGALSYQKKIYGVPIYGESTIFMYNKEMFKAANIQDAPKNKSELLSAMDKLKSAGIPAMILRGDPSSGGSVYIFSGFMFGHGGKYFDSSGNLALCSPENEEAINLYSLILNKYSFGAKNLIWMQCTKSMQEGQAAMWIDATTLSAMIEDPSVSKVAGKIGYALIPQGVSVPSIAVWGLGIPKNSKKKDAAWKFISWAMSKNIQFKTSRTRSDITRASILNDPEYISSHNYDDGNYLKYSYQNISNANPDYRPRIPEWAKLGDYMAVNLEKAMEGKISAKQALKNVQDKMSEIKFTNPN